MVLQEEGSRARCHQKLAAKNYRLGCVRLIKSVPDKAVCSAVGGGETCPPPQPSTPYHRVVDGKVDITSHDTRWSKTSKGKQTGCRNHNPQCATCPETHPHLYF